MTNLCYAVPRALSPVLDPILVAVGEPGDAWRTTDATRPSDCRSGGARRSQERVAEHDQQRVADSWATMFILLILLTLVIVIGTGLIFGAMTFREVHWWILFPLATVTFGCAVVAFIEHVRAGLRSGGGKKRRILATAARPADFWIGLVLGIIIGAAITAAGS